MVRHEDEDGAHEGFGPPQVPAVLSLDVGHTVLFPRTSIGDTYAEVVEAEAGIVVDGRCVDAAFSQAWHREKARAEGLVYGRTHADAVRFWRAIVSDVMSGILTLEDQTGVLEAVTGRLYDEFSHAHRWRVDDGFGPLVSAARRFGMKVVLTSNWDLRLRGLLVEMDLLRAVDALVVSAEEGVEKPASALFLRAAAAVGATPSTVLHVGDTWEEDVAGALSAGMRAAWVNPLGLAKPEPDGQVLSIRSVGDLTEILAGGGGGLE